MAVKRKVVMLGDSAVGKTSLVRRFVLDLFEDSYVTTIGAKVMRKDLRLAGAGREEDLVLMVWDIVGREGYTSFHAKAFAGAKGALLVADLTREETLDSLERYWIPALVRIVGDVPLVFAGNKCDLKEDYAYPPNRLGQIAARHNLAWGDVLPSHLGTWYLTSAKTGQNVQNAFESLGRLMLSKRILADPLKELFEQVTAMDVGRSADRSTPLGVIDAITTDFWEWSKEKIEEDVAFRTIRQEVVRAAIDVRYPTKEGLLRLTEYLAEAESEYLDAMAVKENRDRRLRWIRQMEK